MAKVPSKHGTEWSREDIAKLRDLAKGNTPTRLMAYKLNRTEDSVRSKAADKNISLKPTNRSPYGTKKKSK